MSICECTYKYLSVDISQCVHADGQLPLLTHDTRAQQREREHGIFFSPPCLESTLQRVYNEGKKRLFILSFFFRRATRAVPHKFLFTPQPRYNFVLRKFAAHLWKIISVLHLKLFTSLSFQESHVA